MASREKSEKTSKYSVRTPLRHDGKHYAKGATVELAESDAAVLLDRKVVSRAKIEAATE